MRGSTAAAVPLRRLQTSAKCARSGTANQARGSTQTLRGARFASSASLSRQIPIKNARKYSQVHLARPRGAFVQLRSLATEAGAKADGGGPLAEYDRRVEAGELRNDEHQRGNIYNEFREPFRSVVVELADPANKQESSKAYSISTMNYATTTHPRSYTQTWTR